MSQNRSGQVRPIPLRSPGADALIEELKRKHQFYADYDLSLAFVATWFEWARFWSTFEPKPIEKRRKFLDAIDVGAAQILSAFSTAGDDDLAGIIDSEAWKRYGLTSGQKVITDSELVALRRMLQKLVDVAASARSVLPGKGRPKNVFMAGMLQRLKAVYEKGTGKIATSSKYEGKFRGSFFSFVEDALSLFGHSPANTALGRAIEKALKTDPVVARPDPENKKSPAE